MRTIDFEYDLIILAWFVSVDCQLAGPDIDVFDALTDTADRARLRADNISIPVSYDLG